MNLLNHDGSRFSKIVGRGEGKDWLWVELEREALYSLEEGKILAGREIEGFKLLYRRNDKFIEAQIAMVGGGAKTFLQQECES